MTARQLVLDRLRWRYATKQFDPARRISAEDWVALEEALVLTPSSFGLQPWKFLVIDTPALREQLCPACWGQRQITEASHLVVLLARTGMTEIEIDAHLIRVAEVRGTPVESLGGFRKMLTNFFANQLQGGADQWAAKQCYIALGQLMAAAALLEIDTCPMEGFDPAKVDELLGVTGTGFHTVLLCPVGYRAASDKYATLPKVRFKAEDMIEHR